MKPLRWLLAGLLWILAGVVGLVGAIACVTVILLPVGIPLLMLARRLGTWAGKLLVPKAVRHPARELGKKGSDATDKVNKRSGRLLRRGRKAVTEPAADVRKKAGKKLGRRKGIARWT